MDQPGNNIRAEALESRSRGSLSLWWVADDYTVNSGLIIPVIRGKVRAQASALYEGRSYLPLGRPELPGEFAHCAGHSIDPILAFVRRYGMLGYSAGCGESSTRGDPLTWFLAHAQAVKLVMDLGAALNDPRSLNLILSPMQTEGLWIRTRVPEPNSLWIGSLSGRDDLPGGQRRVAMEIIETIMNKNLGGMRRFLRVEPAPDAVSPESHFVSVFRPQNLLDCIYWIVADALTGNRVRTCSYCGRVFVAPDDRTKYCPPLMGDWGVSSCMNRAKQQRYRERQAGTATATANPRRKTREENPHA